MSKPETPRFGGPDGRDDRPQPLPEPAGGDWDQYARMWRVVDAWERHKALSELAIGFLRHALNDGQRITLGLDVRGRREVQMNGVRYTVGAFEEELRQARRAKLN